MSAPSPDLLPEITRALSPAPQVTLHLPTAADEHALRSAHAELAREDFDFALAELDGSDGDVDRALAKYEREARGADLPPGRVRAEFLLAEYEGEVVGRTSIRYALTSFLLQLGGHIGYAVVPRFRRRGLATAILRASLDRLAADGTTQALVTCSADNEGSRRTIRAAGGILEDVRDEHERYWIDLASPTLRAVTTSDQQLLWRVLGEAFSWREGDQARAEQIAAPQIAHYAAHFGRPGDVGTVAFQGGREAGAAWLRLLPSEDPGYGFVASDIPELTLAVLPGLRGAGLGGRLLDAVLAQARAAGFRGVSLSVEDGNVAARRLYERAGFVPVGRVGNSDTMLREFSAG